MGKHSFDTASGAAEGRQIGEVLNAFNIHLRARQPRTATTAIRAINFIHYFAFHVFLTSLRSLQ
tara:strand:- start:382 stop:573 length:192 start_codon:yes stop_codon:yes gene_type:complete